MEKTNPRALVMPDAGVLRHRNGNVVFKYLLSAVFKFYMPPHFVLSETNYKIRSYRVGSTNLPVGFGFWYHVQAYLKNPRTTERKSIF